MSFIEDNFTFEGITADNDKMYDKLISILIGGHLQTLFNAFIEDKTDFELSDWKAYKIVKKTQKSLEMY